MTEPLERPKFLPSFFSAMAERAESGTLWRMILAVLFYAALGAAVAFFVPSKLWQDSHWEVSTTVYTGILTVNGLILALSWSAFSRIFDIISAPKFCAFLRRNKLLNRYIVTVSCIQAWQIVAVVASAVGLGLVIVDAGYILVDRIALGVMVFVSAYAVSQASSAVGIMNDLVWQKAAFDEHQEHQQGGGNVVRMGDS